MTEPTTESLGAAQEFAAAWERTGRDALSDDAIRDIALALDKMKVMAAGDPLAGVVDKVRHLKPSNGQRFPTDAECAAAFRAELAAIGWQVGPIETPAATETAPVDLMQEAREVVAELCEEIEAPITANGVRKGGSDSWLPVITALAGLKRGMELTPAKPAAHPLTDEQVIENCARLFDAWGCPRTAQSIRKGRLDKTDRYLIDEYRRQTSALTTPDVVTGDMVGRAIGQPTASPILSWSTTHKTGAIHFQTLAYNLNIELLRGRS